MPPIDDHRPTAEIAVRGCPDTPVAARTLHRDLVYEIDRDRWVEPIHAAPIPERP